MRLIIAIMCVLLSSCAIGDDMPHLNCEKFRANYIIAERCYVQHGWIIAGFHEISFYPDEKHEWVLR